MEEIGGVQLARIPGANTCADLLLDLGHNGGFHWTVLDAAPSLLRLALEADARGCVWSRFVPHV